MAEFKDLTTPQKRLVRNLFTAVVKSIANDDPSGHIPNCGYTDEKQQCGCLEFGTRLQKNLSGVVATDTPFPQE